MLMKEWDYAGGRVGYADGQWSYAGEGVGLLWGAELR